MLQSIRLFAPRASVGPRDKGGGLRSGLPGIRECVHAIAFVSESEAHAKPGLWPGCAM